MRVLDTLEGVTGIPSEATYAKRPKASGKSKGAKKSKGSGSKASVRVVDVAEWQEYGTPRIPSRPYFRPAIAARGSDWNRQRNMFVQQAIRGFIAPEQVFSRVALIAAGDIQQAIKAVTAPPLNPHTVARKGFSKPLVDTGRMWQSFTGQVRKRASEGA